MRKYLLHTVFLLSAVLLLAACRESLPEPEEKPLDHRTILVYMVGDNDLSGALWGDLDEMLSGSSAIPDSCNVLVYSDGTDLPCIYRLTSARRLEKWFSYPKEQNSCDSLVFLQVLKKMVHAFPSEHYALVMASHASGWIPRSNVRRRTFGIDNNANSGSNVRAEMEIGMLRGVLETLPHFDYVFFDACFMQSVEVAYELKEVTDCVIGSPAEIPGPGAPYHKMMHALCAADIGQIVNGYHSYYPQGVFSGVVLSAVCTAALDELAYQTVPHVVSLFHGRRENASPFFQDYSPSYHSYTNCFDMNSVMYNLLSDEEYARWEVCFSKAVPFRPPTASWYSSYNYGTTCRVYDAEHYGAVSMYLPSETDYSAKWNDSFKQMRWYKAAGWDHTGW